MPNFMFCGEREHKTTTFFFFSWTSIQSFRIHLQKNLPTFDELNEMEFACVQTSPISFVARTKEIGDVCAQARWNRRDKVWSSANSLFMWLFRSCHRRCRLSSLTLKRNFVFVSCIRKRYNISYRGISRGGFNRTRFHTISVSTTNCLVNELF